MGYSAEAPRQAREAKEREVQDARTEAEHRESAVAEAAEKRPAAAKQQVDEVAAQRKSSLEKGKRGAQAGSGQKRKPVQPHSPS